MKNLFQRKFTSFTIQTKSKYFITTNELLEYQNKTVLRWEYINLKKRKPHTQAWTKLLLQITLLIPIWLETYASSESAYIYTELHFSAFST